MGIKLYDHFGPVKDFKTNISVTKFICSTKVPSPLGVLPSKKDGNALTLSTIISALTLIPNKTGTESAGATTYIIYRIK